MKIIGEETIYRGTEWPLMTGKRVKIVGILKHGLSDPDRGPYLDSNDGLDECGGLGADDSVDVLPWLPGESRFSWAVTGVCAVDLECYVQRVEA